MAAGGGDVVDAARFDRSGPDGEPRWVGDDLHVAALGFVLARVPQVGPCSLRRATPGRSRSMCHPWTHATNPIVCPAQARRAGQELVRQSHRSLRAGSGSRWRSATALHQPTGATKRRPGTSTAPTSTARAPQRPDARHWSRSDDGARPATPTRASGVRQARHRWQSRKTRGVLLDVFRGETDPLGRTPRPTRPTRRPRWSHQSRRPQLRKRHYMYSC